MGFVGVGILMLIIVFVIYMRMINRRFDVRSHRSQTSSLLEKIEILESVGDDKAALKMAQSSLADFPDSKPLKEKIQSIKHRLSESD